MTDNTSLYRGSCHCGAVQFELSAAPEKLVDCNCTICRRLGALWGHVSIDCVKVTAPELGTIAYVHGERSRAMHSCKSCGCTTHWENLEPEGDHMAVNFRMCDPEVIADFRICRFDGADTWEFLD